MRLTVVGMMSGTSHDAVDAAVATLALDGDTIALEPHGLHSEAMPDALRERISACLPPASTTIDEVCRLDTELGQLFGRIAREAIESLADDRVVDLVVSHGQTVFHWVSGARALGTLQLGAPAWIAEATRTTVVSDLRSADVARGGQGAPLASMLDALLVLGDDDRTRRGSLNLGGIANITVRAAGGDVVAYDIGPANALMDAAMTQHSGGRSRMDVDGALAARGRVHPEALARLLDEPFYALPPPKSTGKEIFHAGYVRDRLAGLALSDADLLTTLTELTARIVADASRSHGLTELVVAGGGVRNPTLMARLGELAAPARIRPFDELGLPAQAKEAYLFALLGYLSVHGLPGTIATATGARGPAILGSLTPGGRPIALPPPATTAIRRLVTAPRGYFTPPSAGQ